MTYRRFLILLLVPLSVRASAQEGFSRNVVVSLGTKTYNFYCEGTPGSLSVNITLQEVPVGVTASDLVIRMHFGPPKDSCMLTTFKLENDGRCTQVGEPQSAQEYEYDLYRQATRLNAKYTDGSTAPANPSPRTPSPSLIYEMLRFGRPVGETMPPDVKFGHWRKVATPDGVGWINLNAPKNEGYYGATPYAGISVYSDADFPHWAGWSLIDDDATPDSLCESPTIKHWLDLDRDGHVTRSEAKDALHNSDVKERMSKAICRFPIEWSKHNIGERWGWLKSSHDALSTPLTAEDFDTLKTHIEALAFWDDVQSDPDLPSVDECWHFPPKLSVSHFRKCGWLSKEEIQQLLPTHTIRKDGHGNYHWETVEHGTSTDSVIERYRLDLNKALRKYGICSPLRMAAFFAQATVESAWLTSLREQGGHNPTLHQGWYGRGFLQLTVPGGNLNHGNNNYYEYFHWRGRKPESVPLAQILRWRDDVAEIPDDAAQSSGFYWVKRQFGTSSAHALDTASLYADQPSPNIRVAIQTNQGEKAYYSNETARKTAAIVNVPGAVYNAHYAVNGLTDRFCAYANALVVLTDTPSFPDEIGSERDLPENFQRRKSW